MVHQYINYSEAIESQSWKGEWLPKLLPKDAINAFESHYIDMICTIVSFNFLEDFKEILDLECTKTGGYHIEFTSLKASWWPNELTEKASSITMS